MLKAMYLINQLTRKILSAFDFLGWNRNVLGPVRKTSEVYGGDPREAFPLGSTYVIDGVEGEFFVRIFDLEKKGLILVKEDGYKRVLDRPKGNKVTLHSMKTEPLSNNGVLDIDIRRTLHPIVMAEYKDIQANGVFQDLSIR